MTRTRIALLMSVIPFALIAQERSMNVGDATLNYDVTGNGKPIVLIHGWAQDLSIWGEQVALLAPAYRVIRYDVRGFGKSTGHADITADADDLRILLDSLGIRSAYVLGLSRGASVALNFAVAFPGRTAALVLYGCPPPQGFQPQLPGPGPVAVFGEIARKHGLDSAGRAVYASPLIWIPPAWTAERKAEHRKRFDTMWAKYKGRDLLDPRPPSGRVAQARVDQLSAVRTPTLVIHGDHEMPVLQLVADTLMRRIPNARRVVVANAGHGAHFDNPAQFNDALMAFFRSVDRH